MFNEDHTAAVLNGTPIFCVNRTYKHNEQIPPFIKNQYRFEFDNGFGASIVEFADKNMSGGARYELGVLKYHGYDHNLTYDTPITEDVERGDEYYMHKLLNEIEALGKVISVDNE